MKRFILLLTILYPFCLFAQDDDYRPLIEEGKAWVSFNPINLQSTPPFWGYTQYDKIEGDTVVNGKPCKIWIQNYARRTDEYGHTDGSYELTHKIPVYEEDKKVWFFMEGDKEPRLAFDFGAGVGDKVIVQSIEGMYMDYYKKYLSDKYIYADLWSDTLSIKSQTKMEVGGREQRVTYYTSHLFKEETFMEYVYLMEGIGSNEGSVKNIGPNSVSWNGISQLVFCWVGDEVLYYDPKPGVEYAIDIPFPTSITAPHSTASSENRSSSSANWADLSGHRLSSPPSRPGLYIRDGRKVVVK